MATDPPKRRTGGSKKFQDASDELRLHMSIRAKVTRMSEMLDREKEMLDRQGQVNSAQRELLSGILVDLDKQGEKFMTRVEDSAEPSTPLPAEPTPDTRPSAKPTRMALNAMNARSFEEYVRDQYKSATNEAQRSMALDTLKNGLRNTPGFAADERLQGLEAELRRR